MQKQKLNELLSELSAISDRDERMEYLIELAGEFGEVPPEVATRPFPESSLVPACQSEAYAFASRNPDGTLKFHFAVENPQGISAKAMAAIIDRTLSGATPQEVLAAPSDMVYEIFGRNIAMGKGQGLMSMLFAVQALTKQFLKQSV